MGRQDSDVGLMQSSVSLLARQTGPHIKGAGALPSIIALQHHLVVVAAHRDAADFADQVHSLRCIASLFPVRPIACQETLHRSLPMQKR